MNGSTDRKLRPLYSSWQFKFFAAAVVLLLAVGGYSMNFFLPPNTLSVVDVVLQQLVLAPATAGRNTITAAIAEFSGRLPAKAEWTQYLSACGSLILVFVVGPTSFIVLRNMMKNYRRAQRSPPVIVKGMYGIGFAWFVLIPAAVIASAWASANIFPTMKKDNSMAEYRDRVTSDLAVIAYKTEQFFILPVSEGGGEGSFRKGEAPVTLEDLGLKERTSLGRFVLFAGNNDTTMQLLFFGNRVLSKNPGDDQEIDKVVEYQVSIYPTRYQFTKVH